VPAGAGQGFTLIEIIAVMTVVAILATAILTATLRQLDRIAGERERDQLKAFAEAYENHSLRWRRIPGATGATNWAEAIALELGADTNSVLTNPRRWPRVFVVDNLLQVGTNSGKLPYSQTLTGSVVTVGGAVVRPPNARAMILSALGTTNLPSIKPADFKAIWDTADGTVPTTGTSFIGWRGTGDDLKIQRINLSPLFVHLVLANYPLATSTNIQPGRYTLDSQGPQAPSDVSRDGRGLDTYVLRHSVLGLYDNTGRLQTREILDTDVSYVCANGVWRGGAFAVLTNTAAGMTGLAFEVLARQFEVSPGNLNYAGYPRDVLAAMQNFMSAYLDWSGHGFPTTGSYYTNVEGRVTALKTATDGLVNNITEGACK
jgi:prepilin-type N-terminal cleavage/methylation domain-containing protein